MICLTQINGDPIWVAAEKIECVDPYSEGGCHVVYGDNWVDVRESAQDVADKVLSYKIGVSNYISAQAASLLDPGNAFIDRMRHREVLDLRLLARQVTRND